MISRVVFTECRDTRCHRDRSTKFCLGNHRNSQRKSKRRGTWSTAQDIASNISMNLDSGRARPRAGRVQGLWRVWRCAKASVGKPEMLTKPPELGCLLTEVAAPAESSRTMRSPVEPRGLGGRTGFLSSLRGTVQALSIQSLKSWCYWKVSAAIYLSPCRQEENSGKAEMWWKW